MRGHLIPRYVAASQSSNVMAIDVATIVVLFTIVDFFLQDVL